MKRLLQILPLLFLLFGAAVGCTTETSETDGEDVPFEQMDRDTLEVEPGRAFEDTVVVDTTAVE